MTNDRDMIDEIEDETEKDENNIASTSMTDECDSRPSNDYGGRDRPVDTHVSDEIGTSQLQPEDTYPGAYRVNNGRISLVASDESLISSLPQAFEVESAFSSTNESNLIYGEVVTSTTRLIRFGRTELGMLCVFILSSVILTLCLTLIPKNVESMPSNSPISHRSKVIRELLIPISGADALDEERSPQQIAFQFVAELDAQLIPLNNTKKLIQRYSVITVGLGLITQRISQKLGLNRNMHMDECELGLCNEFGEMTGYSFANFSKFSTGLNITTGLGRIEKEIGQLTSLKYLLLYNNAAQGTIPSELGLCQDLEVLDLSKNLFTGTIPTQIGRLSHLRWMNMGKNKLEGDIPTQVGNLSNLFYIDISQNSLSSSIPKDIENLTNLNGLAVYKNSLSGNAEFLCSRNVIAAKFSYEVEEMSYFSSVDLGFSVDCTHEKLPVLNCSCCMCF